jgi:hypothetical protein
VLAKVDTYGLTYIERKRGKQSYDGKVQERSTQIFSIQEKSHLQQVEINKGTNNVASAPAASIWLG